MKNDTFTKKSDVKVITLCILLSLALFALDSSIPLGVAGGVPYITVVLISLWARAKKLPLYMAFLGSALTIAGFYSSPTGGELWKVLVNRFLALFAIWVVATLSMQRRSMHDEREKSWLEVKTLRGFLPICAACKNIRDDKGYWNRIESYIKEHSEVEFTHGLCPDCAKRLYPELDLHKLQ